MRELQLPVCALIFTLLLCVIYFSKKRINSTENKLYSTMLIMGLLDCIILVFERSLALSGDVSKITPMVIEIAQITNKIDCGALIVLTTCLFLYTLNISFPKIKNHFKKIVKTITIIDVIIFLYVCILKIDVITYGNIISVSGGGIIPAYITCGIYILLSVFISLINIKKFNKKYIPMLSIIFIFIFLMIVFKSNPYIMVISITITFINYLMFFTIENPDLQMLNELLRNRELVENQIEDKSMFLFEVSEEIKNTISDINNLVRAYDNLDDLKDKNNVVRSISLSSRDLEFKMNNILNISSEDAAKLKLLKNAYNTKMFFKSLQTYTNNMIKDKNIILNCSIEDSIPNNLYGDDFRLKQVLVSILISAAKNTKEGVIT